jgi:hypothetical protein
VFVRVVVMMMVMVVFEFRVVRHIVMMEAEKRSMKNIANMPARSEIVIQRTAVASRHR